MDARFECTKPEDIEMSMTITMTLHRWMELKKQLVNEYPSWDLSSKITDMVFQANKQFMPEDKE